MRKFIALLGAAAIASVMPATPALADGSVVIGDQECAGFVPVADQSITLANALYTDDESHQVIRGDTATLTCHFDIPDDRLPSKGVKQMGFTCQRYFSDILTNAYYSRMAASPGGRAVLTCKFLLPTTTSLKIRKR